MSSLKAGRFYINLHSSTFSGGELRGQVLKPGEILYLSRMTGAAVAPAPDAGVSTNSGTMSFVLNAAKNSLFYNGSVTGITTVGSLRLMDGVAGSAGSGPVYTLSSTLSGTQAVALDMTKLDSAGYYSDVTTTSYPAGEIRDQLNKEFVAP